MCVRLASRVQKHRHVPNKPDKFDNRKGVENELSECSMSTKFYVMINHKLYFKDGTLFADSYERVVHGKRGKYVELTKNQIKVKLKSKFKQDLPENITNEDFYYYWLIPEERDEKIYWQCNLVTYADYKIGYYYISPKLLMPFDNKQLF